MPVPDKLQEDERNLKTPLRRHDGFVLLNKA